MLPILRFNIKKISRTNRANPTNAVEANIAGWNEKWMVCVWMTHFDSCSALDSRPLQTVSEVRSARTSSWVIMLIFNQFSSLTEIRHYFSVGGTVNNWTATCFRFLCWVLNASCLRVIVFRNMDSLVFTTGFRFWVHRFIGKTLRVSSLTACSQIGSNSNFLCSKYINTSFSRFSKIFLNPICLRLFAFLIIRAILLWWAKRNVFSTIKPNIYFHNYPSYSMWL